MAWNESQRLRLAKRILRNEGVDQDVIDIMAQPLAKKSLKSLRQRYWRERKKVISARLARAKKVRS